MKLILNNEFGLYQEGNDKIFCDSLMIAESFVKRHDNVLSDIKNLDCSDDFRLLNFKESSYKNEQNKKQPKYLMTKDGFTFLVMGYRGKKAAAFKESYINRFNQMEQFIHTLFEVRLDFPELTEAIQHFYIEPKGYHYSNEMDMINRIVLGMNAKKFKEVNNVPADIHSIRPYLSAGQIDAISRLQKTDIGLLYAGKNFDERKQILHECFARMTQRRIA